MSLPFSIDLGRALFSVGMALILYLFALNETNPEATRATDFPGGIPVEVVNRPGGLLLADRPQAIQARVRAPQDVLARLRPDNFVALVDASSAQAGVVRLPISVRATDPEVRDVAAVPDHVQLRFEQIQERSLPLRVATTGQVPAGYQVGTPRAEPSRITVSGPESVVRGATEALVEVNVERVTVTVNGAFTPRVVDSRGNEVRDLTLRPASVNLEIPITQHAQYKEIGIRPRLTGRPAPGYYLEPVEVDPPTVTIFGETSGLEGANLVNTAPIDVNGLNSTIVRRVPLEPPSNTLLLQPGQTVDVTIRASPLTITQTLRVLPTLINLSPGLVISRFPDPVEVQLSGPAPTLSQLTARDLRVTVDLNQRSAPGRYELQARVETPQGMTLERIEPRTVVVEVREAPTPVPPPQALTRGTPTP